MTLRKVFPGEQIAIQADTWNSFIDAAQDFKNRTVNIGRDASAASMPSTTVITIKNKTGDDLKRFDVVGIVRPLFKKDEAGSVDLKNLLAFETVDPANAGSAGATGFVILLEDIQAGNVGKAAASGICYARLLTVLGSVSHARPSSDHGYKLVESSHGGPFRVLWHDDVELNNVDPSIYQEVDAVVAFDTFDELLVNSTWVRILAKAEGGGLYPDWEIVAPELADDGETVMWKSVFHTAKDELLFEANLLETVEPDTVVMAHYAGLLHAGKAPDAKQYKVWLFNHGSGAQGGGVGFGVPAPGQSDIPYSEDIELTVTDTAGVPITDEFGNIQRIKVWRNATRQSVYTDFSANTIFTYARFRETPTGHRGCIFSRTESFRSHGSFLPSGGIDVENSGKQPPLSVDATGDPSNVGHVHVRGNMYVSAASGGNGFAPWAAIDPKKLGIKQPGNSATQVAGASYGGQDEEFYSRVDHVHGCPRFDEEREPGPEGPPGKDGIDGVDGKDGEQGPPGQDGRDGKDGIDGAPGRDGIDGKDGQEGPPGKDGRDGTDGQDGKDGSLDLPNPNCPGESILIVSPDDPNPPKLGHICTPPEGEAVLTSGNGNLSWLTDPACESITLVTKVFTKGTALMQTQQTVTFFRGILLEASEPFDSVVDSGATCPS